MSQINVRNLRPTLSGGEMWYYDPRHNSDKVYRGHLTYLADQKLWVSWVEYGRRGAANQRSLVTKTGVSAVAAMTALNARVASKEDKGYQGWGQVTMGLLQNFLAAQENSKI